jgi:small Trp-rich protein
MLFVIVGVLIIAMNVVGIGPVADWNWDITGDLWKFCVPFLLALLWWIWSDKSGLDKRREMEKMELRKENRRRETSSGWASTSAATARTRRRNRPS